MGHATDNDNSADRTRHAHPYVPPGNADVLLFRTNRDVILHGAYGTRLVVYARL